MQKWDLPRIVSRWGNDKEYRLLLEDDENIFAYERTLGDQTLVVVCNFFGKTIDMPLMDKCKDMQVLLGNYADITEPQILRPYEARIYLK